MAFQLQKCGDWRHNALQAVFEPPWEKRGGAGKIGPRAQQDERSTFINQTGTVNKAAVSLSDRLNGLTAHFAARPRYSSLLRLTRNRRHELKMETRDRVYLSISDWVFRRVKDPLVEIDPVTVNEVITAEREAESRESGPEGSTVASTNPSPSHFRFLPPGSSKDAKGAALGVLLLLVALAIAAIFAWRGKKSSVTVFPPAGNNGGARQEAGDDSEDQKPSTSATQTDEILIGRPATVIATPFQSQPYPSPIPSYSSSLEQSNLPISSGPSPSSRTGKKIPSVPTRSGTSALSEAEVRVKSQELAVSGNGGATTITLESFEMESQQRVSISNESLTVTDTLISTVSVKELTAGTDAIEEIPVESSLIQKRSSSAENITGELAAASAPVAELPNAYNEEVYLLVGDATTLFTIGELAGANEQIVPLQMSADLRVSGDLILVEESAGHGLLEVERLGESMRVNSSIDQDAVPEGSLHFGGPEFPPSIQALLPASDAQAVADRRKESTQVLERVLPAVSVGAGAVALSSFSGVDGALEMVGFLATANFLTRDFIWAGQREQLLKEIRDIKDHKQLLQFLQRRNIIPEAWIQ